MTVKSDHPPKGEFDCYDPVFRSGGIDGVLQVHNHSHLLQVNPIRELLESWGWSFVNQI